jgi:outer membrane protein OmpA-like peptidoglycan-associated protein
MRLQKLVIAASALLFLSGCTSDSKFHDFGAWYNNKPSRMEKKWGPMTSGYFGQNAAGRAVLKPPGREQPTKEDLNPPLVDGDIVAVTPVENESVTVFPVEQDDTGVVPHHMIEEGGAEPAPVYSEPMAANYGEKVDQLYFAHGSARIGARDHKHLAVVAKKVMKRQSPNLTVVGHASRRVNTTDDPVRKKEINFEMAQKRANAVTNALTQQGVDPGWVMAVSKGDEEPNLHRGKRSQESADRRVEVFVNGQK